MAVFFAFLIILFLAPYIVFVWIYGVLRVKRLLEKEYARLSTAVQAYEQLSPEQRMHLTLHPITHQEQGTTTWLDSPSPEEAALKRQHVERQEKERTSHDGQWTKAVPEVPPLSRLP